MDDTVLEAYEKLGYVYDRLGDHKKLYATMRLAAIIKQTDTDSWLECARKASSPEVSLWKESIKCYNRVIKQLNHQTDKRLVINLKFEKFKSYYNLNQWAYIIKQIKLLTKELLDIYNE